MKEMKKKNGQKEKFQLWKKKIFFYFK